MKTKIIIKTDHFLVILLYFTIMYNLEVIYIYCTFMAKILQKSVLLCITSQFWVQ